MWKPTGRDLSNQYVSLPQYLNKEVNFWGEFESTKQFLERFCSDSNKWYHHEVRQFLAIPTEWCLLFHFILETNVTVQETDLARRDKLNFIQKLKFPDISRRGLHTNMIDIHPHAETHDGLFYSVFINKSELGTNLNLIKPFNGYVWITFISSGVLLSVGLCVLLDKRWTYIGLQSFGNLKTFTKLLLETGIGLAIACFGQILEIVWSIGGNILKKAN
ncbi:hypothetical protein Fcan01_17092 [Folsomia candida]|uniref:Uncharacterized protein n=1 Tax=Folsomia candida TaxID=158441 RepID=A0A226DSN0_FOLCA|nr:hypothetical protein Fcan01_17092 [Folsomia candida]